MEHLVNPFAEPMGEAADVGADRVGWPSSIFHPFVDFVGDVKLTIGFFGWYGCGFGCILCPFYLGAYGFCGAMIGWCLLMLRRGSVHPAW